jgi:hypothetical protein
LDCRIDDRLGAVGYLLPVDDAALKRWAGVSEDVKRSPLLQGADWTHYGVPFNFNADRLLTIRMQSEKMNRHLINFYSIVKPRSPIGNEDTWLTTLPMAPLYLKTYRPSCAGGRRRCRSTSGLGPPSHTSNVTLVYALSSVVLLVRLAVTTSAFWLFFARGEADSVQTRG